MQTNPRKQYFVICKNDASLCACQGMGAKSNLEYCASVLAWPTMLGRGYSRSGAGFGGASSSCSWLPRH